MSFDFKTYCEEENFDFTQAQINSVNKSISKLSEWYWIEKIPVEDYPLSKLGKVGENNSFNPILCFKANIKDIAFYIYFINVISESKKPLEARDAIEVWGLKELEEDFGNILIRKEHFSDRITELLKNFEVDFDDDKEFSKTFYVQTEEKELARNFLTPQRRKILKKFPEKDFYLEICGNIITFGLSKNISATYTLNIAKMLEVI